MKEIRAEQARPADFVLQVPDAILAGAVIRESEYEITSSTQEGINFLLGAEDPVIDQDGIKKWYVCGVRYSHSEEEGFDTPKIGGGVSSESLYGLYEAFRLTTPTQNALKSLSTAGVKLTTPQEDFLVRRRLMHHTIGLIEVSRVDVEEQEILKAKEATEIAAAIEADIRERSRRRGAGIMSKVEPKIVKLPVNFQEGYMSSKIGDRIKEFVKTSEMSEPDAYAGVAASDLSPYYASGSELQGIPQSGELRKVHLKLLDRIGHESLGSTNYRVALESSTSSKKRAHARHATGKGEEALTRPKPGV